MIIGVPKETKPDEYRVGLLAVGAELLSRDGHTVLIETGAAQGSGFGDELYSGVAVPGYLAKEAGRKYRVFVPNDSMICNFC